MQIDCGHFLGVHPGEYPKQLVVEALSCEGVSDGRVRLGEVVMPVLEEVEHTAINKRTIRRVYSEILRLHPDEPKGVFRLSSATWVSRGDRYHLRPIYYCVAVSFNGMLRGGLDAWFINVSKRAKPFAEAPRQPFIDLWTTVPGGGRDAWEKEPPTRWQRLLSEPGWPPT